MMKSLYSSLTLLALGTSVLSYNSTPTATPLNPLHHTIGTYSAHFGAPLPTPQHATHPAIAPDTILTMNEPFKQPSPTLAKREGVCQGGQRFCDSLANCCPSGSYCTVDLVGAGACCASGATCTGLSTSVPGLSIGILPGGGARSTLKPAKVFSILARFVNFVSTTTPLEGNSNATASDAESKKGGGGGHGGGGGGGHGGEGGEGGGGGSGSSSGGGAARGGVVAGSGRSSAVPGSEPHKLFALPVALARLVIAAPVQRSDSSLKLEPKVKFTGPNPGLIKADQNLTSTASGMPRPLKLFSMSIALAQRIQAAFSPVEGSAPKSVPKLKFMGANLAFIRAQNETSGCPGKPRPNPIVSSVGAFLSKVKAALPSNPLAFLARSDNDQPPTSNTKPAVPTPVINETLDHRGGR